MICYKTDKYSSKIWKKMNKPFYYVKYESVYIHILVLRKIWQQIATIL